MALVTDIKEACLGFYGYRIFDILLPGIWDTLFNIFVYFYGYGIYGKLIIGIVVSVFQRGMGYLPSNFK